MGRSKFIYLFMVVVFITDIYPQKVQAQDYTLMETIRTALSNNPKTRANDSRIKAMEERTRAAWLAMLPTIGTSYTVQKTTGQGTNNGTPIIDNSYKYDGYTLSLNANIFNGGIDKLRAESSEAYTRAQKDRFDGTTSFIPNTKGSMSILVVNNFLNIVLIRTELEFFRNLVMPAAETLSKAAIESQDKNRISSFIRALNDSIIRMTNQLDTLSDDYQYIVTLPVPSHLEPYEASIIGFNIPQTPEEAIAIGLEKNSEIKAAKSMIIGAEKEYMAAQRQVLNPRLDLLVQKNNYNNVYPDINYRSNDKFVGLTFSMSFSPSSTANVAAAAQEKNVASYERDSAADDVKQNLRQLYKNLEYNMALLTNYQNNFQISQSSVNAVLADLAASKKVNYEYTVSRLNEWMNDWESVALTNGKIIQFKFGIQRVAGTLFDSIGLKEEP